MKEKSQLLLSPMDDMDRTWAGKKARKIWNKKPQRKRLKLDRNNQTSTTIREN